MYATSIHRTTLQSVYDHAKGVGQAVTDAFAQGTQTARDATKPYADSAADKAQSAKDSLTPNQGTTGTKSMSGPGSISGEASAPHLCFGNIQQLNLQLKHFSI